MTSPFNYGSDPSMKKPVVPARPEPELQDNQSSQPWFVEEVTVKPSVNEKAKTAVKRTTSVLFPLIGLVAIIGVPAITVYLVMGLYE